jgi:hypothetical protein
MEKITVCYYKNQFGFYNWFIKDQQIDFSTNQKSFQSAKKEILTDLRQKNLAFNFNDIIFYRTK